MISPNMIRAILAIAVCVPFVVACEDEAAPEPTPAEPTEPAAPVAPEEVEAEPTEAEADEDEAADAPAADIPEEAYGTYDIDAVHSSVVFASGHFGVGSIYGMFNDIQGSYVIAEDPAESSVELQIAADSIFSGNRQRDDDLKGPDFLHTGQFPEITFESTEVRRTDAGFEVDGNLTLRGETQPTTIDLTYIGAGTVPLDDSYRTGFEGEVTIDRTEFGIEAMPEAVGREIRLIPAIEGIRQ